MWQLTPRLVRQLQVVIASLTSCNLFLIIANFGFGMGNRAWMDSNLLLLPQVIVNLFALFYSYFKFVFLYRWIFQLIMSLILSGVYIFFAAKVFPLSFQESGQFLMRVVESINVILALMLITESILAAVVVRKEKIDRLMDISPRNNTNGATDSADGTQVPQQIHIYQPRLGLAGQRISVLSGSTAVTVTGGGTAGTAQSDPSYRIDILREGEEGTDNNDDEGLELEELPKYQRRPPAQSATIVDLSNLQGVDPAVLTSVLGETALEIQSRVQHQQERSQLDVEALEVTEAPAYSPRLTASDDSQTIEVPNNITVAGSTEESSSTSLLSPTEAGSVISSAPAQDSQTAPASAVSTVITIAPPEPPVYMP